MADIQSITLTGNVGRDPELKTIGNDLSVVNLSLATSRYKKGGNVSDWYELSAFGKTAEVINSYIAKGDSITVSGQPFIDIYTNKEGKEVKSIKVKVDNVKLPKKSESNKGSESKNDEWESDIPW